MATEIIKAVIYNDAEKIQQFITNEEGEINGELLDIRDDEGKSPLDIACMLGKVDVIEGLIANGANMDSISSQGNTAMHRAASWGRIECLKILAEKGANLHLKNLKGECPRDIARRYGHSACYDYLVRAAIRRNYKYKMLAYNETLTDHDLIAGKLNKDDRIQAAALFKTLTEWYESNTDPIIAEVQEQTKVLLEGVLPFIRKLIPEKVNKELLQEIKQYEEDRVAEQVSQQS
ncbi:Ankyrin repeat domain-containing protein 45 [Trichoplax sp. H2]|uniref:Uncharacterized protein n=1 Tax=Trichoplax adhaerens TaxID=10228 RepID=B3RP15_TRIAD|nr:hypothetical protein TRIADDRAFT_53367 [Trichoplax adhaerens]EDV27554.1 hypothetical protein TRIADDRAFT_53367 [Trichoplax adhaerens]RDD43460.1 Ankyrin repeat domain-containing protein 45 [Trichoplax sp. H2]|eukprot:XP_002109388.1 hypothetical protein TRIADDRAFT_53367 [Trichoplax adhaerens]